MLFSILMLAVAGLNLWAGNKAFANPNVPIWVPKLNFTFVGWSIAFAIHSF